MYMSRWIYLPLVSREQGEPKSVALAPQRIFGLCRREGGIIVNSNQFFNTEPVYTPYI